MRAAAPRRITPTLLAGLAVLVAATAGCTSPLEYLHNGFKVGPNYCPPRATVGGGWLDAGNPHVSNGPPAEAAWWRTFGDPVLDALVCAAYRQNLTLRVAGLRILEARAQRNIVAGELFPQAQNVFGSYARQAMSSNVANPIPTQFFSEWQAGAALAWELDFWGRFRRAIEAADAEVNVAVENYDDVLVLLVSEVAQRYIDLRTAEQRIQYAAKNIVIQTGSADFAELLFVRGEKERLDMTQARSNLSQTQAIIAPLESQRRQAANQLCILLGTTPGALDRLLANPAADVWLRDSEMAVADRPNLRDDQAINRKIAQIHALRKKKVERVIPTAPPQVAAGVPADLLRRRPDVRRAEREVAAQSARIGVAVSDLYPHFAISGTIFFDAEKFQDLFKPGSLAGNVGPSFRWDVLHYGRLLNNIRVQDTRFREQVVDYQNIVLRANAEAENAIIGFLKAQQQVQALTEGTGWADQSLDLAQLQFENGNRDFNRMFNVQQTLTLQEDQLAVAQGAVLQNLILLYRALGGGWQIRLGDASPPGTGDAGLHH